MISLYDYQIRILKQDMGKMFLPMYFYNEEINGIRETNIKYDFGDCISLFEWLNLEENSLLDVLNALEDIAILLNKCKEVLINYEYLKIDMTSIFVSTKGDKDIKLQYIPKDEMDEKFCFSKLVKDIEGIAENYLVKEYLQMIAQKLENDNTGLQRIINFMGQIKREVYICGWIGKSPAI